MEKKLCISILQIGTLGTEKTDRRLVSSPVCFPKSDVEVWASHLRLPLQSVQWNRHVQEEHHPPSLCEEPTRPLEAASRQCYHQSQRELLLKTSSHLCLSNWRQPCARALALCYQVTVTSWLPLKIPQISRRINEQMGWRHQSWWSWLLFAWYHWRNQTCQGQQHACSPL